MISRNVPFSPIAFLLIALYNPRTFTRAYTHISVCIQNLRRSPWRSEKLARYPIPFPDRTARCSSQFHFDPSHRANSTPVLCTCSVCKGEFRGTARCSGRVRPSFMEFLPNDSRHYLRKLCADTSHSFPRKVNRAYRRDRAFGFSCYNIKLYFRTISWQRFILN